MKQLLILIFTIMNSITSNACEKEIIKFVAADETIIFYDEDFLEVDTVNSLLTFSKTGVEKLSKIENEKGLFYLYNLKNEWIKIDIFDARQSTRGEAPIIITLKNKLLFYSKNQLVVQGEIWFSIAKRANINVKN